jgi:hypothetical protein
MMRTLVTGVLLTICLPWRTDGNEIASRFVFPKAEQGRVAWQQQTPTEVGLDPGVIAALEGTADRWALWRDGRLIHVSGDFEHKQDVASLRKTWHALTVGAALGQGKIKSLDEAISRWETDLAGEDAKATWRHVITQSSAFDYPYGEWPDYLPGRIWTYSDKNPVRLCGALAKLYGRKDYHDNYDAVLKAAYFDAVGLAGWSTGFTRKDDGVRLHLNLDHMGRLGLLVLARGQWNGRQVIPRSFVEELESKQTHGMLANYHGPDDGDIGLDPAIFPEMPYGYMTWVNTDGDYYPGADRGWAWGTGAGGNVILWNYRFGIVYAAQGMNRPPAPVKRGVPQVIEQHLKSRSDGNAVDLFGRFEKSVTNAKRYNDPYGDVTLDVVLRRPDGGEIRWWGFYDGEATWRLRYAPEQVGVWKYEARFSDGKPGASGSFEVLRSDRAARIDVYRHNPVWFGQAGAAQPLVVRGLHIGDRFFAANWSNDERRAFLDWAQANKYNLLSIASHFLNRDAPGRGQGWQTPKLWPLDAAEYRRMEAILDELAARQMFVFPFAGFFGQRSNYPRDPADQERYVRYTLARLAPYGNMLWNVAGPEPNLRESWMASADVERLGRLIKKLDPLAHPISVHNRTGDDPYRDSDWTTYGVLQGPKSLDRLELSRGLLESHHPAKPLMAQETLWSGNVNHIRRFGGKDYSDDDLRKNTYVIHMSAAALVFADNDGDSSSGFSGTLALADCRQSRHDIIRGAWDCVEGLGTHRMKPRQDLVNRGYCLAEPGEAYLVYLESPGPVDVMLDGGRYRVTWIDPRKPGERRDAGTTSHGKALAPPAISEDWLLQLTRDR